MRRPEPIHVVDLFPAVRRALLTLLRGLGPEEWQRPTACAQWNVKDVALHLLADDIGVLSRRRDAFAPHAKSIHSWEDLVALINRLNEVWVQATRRMSPRVLCDLLDFTGPQVEAYFASLDPHAVDVPVDWVSPEPAPVWLDLAREYTERWHHQQQIRDAVGRPGLKERRYFAPVLDAFVRALPRTFRSVEAPAGTMVALRIAGDSGGEWFVTREGSGWELYLEAAAQPTAAVVLDQDDTWRLFTKGLKPEMVRSRAQITGDPALAEHIFRTVAILG